MNARRIVWGLCLLFLPCLMPLAHGQVLQTVLTNGPLANRLNIVVLSEGYTTNQMSRFWSDATNLVEDLLSYEPYAEYRSYCNAFAIWVPSKQAGSAHPQYALAKSTYFGSSYDKGSDRVVTIPPSGQAKVTALLRALMPKAGFTILAVNDLIPGGSGGAVCIVATSGDTAQMLAHESGHSLARLGDEYSDTYQSEGINNSTVEEPNTTRETRRDRIKWKSWIEPGTPVPTTNSDAYSDKVGLFQGAHYHASGWYRPKLDCLMRSLDSGAPFCEVCSEAIVKAIYQKAQSIDSVSPAAGRLWILPQQVLPFSVVPQKPASHELSIQWYLNGQALAGATNPAFDLSGALAVKAVNTLTVEARDTTSLVRNDPAGLLKDSASWTVLRDFTKPAIAIVAPANRSRLAAGTIVVTGRAADNLEVTNVQWQVNNGGFADASSSNRWSTWQSSFPARAGTNWFEAVSIDSSGNRSATASRLITYVVQWPLAAQKIGIGALSPDLNGRLLEIGKPYRMAALPGKGQLFAGWDGGIRTPILTFAMESNKQVTASFTPNPFPAVKGNYNGLFMPTNGVNCDNSGFLRFTLNELGGFSGMLIGPSSYGFSGGFWVDGAARAIIPRRGKPPLAIELFLDLTNGSDRAQGTVTDGSWVSVFSGDRALFDIKKNPWQPAGNQTLRFLREDFSMPMGDGTGTVSVDGSGIIRLNGTLADGTAISQTVSAAKDGRWPLFATGYGAQGMFLGWAFVNRGTGAIGGELEWIRLPSNGRYYPAGFTNRASIESSAFLSVKGHSLLEFTNAEVVLSGGGLSVPMTNRLVLSTNNGAMITSGTNKLALTLTPSSGVISGGFYFPGAKAATPIKAAVFQNQNTGAGLFLGTNQSGAFLLHEGPSGL